jgi:integrase
MVQLALETAMRRGELTRIERKRIDLRHCVLVLPDTRYSHVRGLAVTEKLSNPIGQQERDHEGR